MTSTTDRVHAVVIEAIAESISVDPATIQPDTAFEDDLGIDSTELIGIIVDIETALQVSLKGVDYAGLKTPADLVAATLARLRVAEPA
ncbi:acyl carrier protein [Roseospira goensis]|uniref:Acyl carrier protein n=1 Tax=Roseospira goensis TaxID=391922 RepID=A0A7W6RZQ4_9PROT|nr:acyl carrier protein [Roseospira goensis]MBB4285700.1 acyl carrier protein [Roseospira goensis]